jgi:hypothetical protein
VKASECCPRALNIPISAVAAALQIFFSWRNPIFSIHKLGLMGAIYYNYGTL